MATPQRLSSSLRGLAGTVLELLQVRLELLSVEAQEEVLRVGALMVYGAIAVTFLSLGLTFLALLITVALWDSHRLLGPWAFSPRSSCPPVVWPPGWHANGCRAGRACSRPASRNCGRTGRN